MFRERERGVESLYRLFEWKIRLSYLSLYNIILSLYILMLQVIEYYGFITIWRLCGRSDEGIKLYAKDVEEDPAMMMMRFNTKTHVSSTEFHFFQLTVTAYPSGSVNSHHLVFIMSTFFFQNTLLKLVEHWKLKIWIEMSHTVN